jgi:uncharacterized protein (DUF2132 family)
MKKILINSNQINNNNLHQIKIKKTVLQNKVNYHWDLMNQRVKISKYKTKPLLNLQAVQMMKISIFQLLSIHRE